MFFLLNDNEFWFITSAVVHYEAREFDTNTLRLIEIDIINDNLLQNVVKIKHEKLIKTRLEAG